MLVLLVRRRRRRRAPDFFSCGFQCTPDLLPIANKFNGRTKAIFAEQDEAWKLALYLRSRGGSHSASLLR